MSILPPLLVVLLLPLAVACTERPAPLPPEEAVRTTTTTVLELRARGLERHARQVTVRVRNRTCAGLGTGSGTVIGPQTLVTNRHVVEGALELGIETWDGRSLTADVASTTSVADLAIVQVSERLPEAVELRDGHAPAGEPVMAVGYPGGGPLTFSKGAVVDYAVADQLALRGPVLRVSAAIEPGSSGGPVLDGEGRLIGVVVAKEVPAGNGLAIPVDVLQQVQAEQAFDEPVPSC